MSDEEQMNVRDEAGYSVNEKEVEEGVTTEDGNVADMRDECVFARGGMCKTHQKMSKKIVIQSLKWRQDKFGIFKYMRSQTTKYKNTPTREQSIAAEVGNSQRFREYTNSGPSVGLSDRSGDLPDSVKERVFEY